MIRIEQFKATDFLLIQPCAIDKEARLYAPKDILKMGKFHEQQGCGFTGWMGSLPLGSLGIDEVRPGVGQMWSMLHVRTRDHVYASMKAVRKMLRIIDDTYDFKRLRSESRIGFAESQRFLEFLGFERGRRTIMNNTHYFYRRNKCRQ